MRAIGRMLVVFTLALAGCGGGTRVGGPSSATGIIEGTVSGAGAATLAVEVPGGPATATDASGTFVLTDVPAGAATLRFKGGTVDATLTIPAMLAGEYRRLLVTVSGTSALEHRAACQTEFRGTIEDLDATTQVLTVSGRKVAVSDTTEIRKGDAAATFADLAKDQRVEVRGTLQSDSSVAARSVRILLGPDPVDDPSALVLFGTLVARDGTNLTVSGLPVDASAAEIWKGDAKVTVDDLVIGDRVIVRGVFKDGAIVASRVRVLVREGEPPELHVSGKVTAVDLPGSTFTVGDTKVAVDGETEWKGEGSPSLETLEVGDLVDAEVVKQADDSLLAKVVKVCPAPHPDVVALRGTIEAVVTDPGAEGVTLLRPRDCGGAAGEVKLAVTPDTKLLRGDVPIGLADLVLGEPAFAKATRASDGSLTALVILVAPPCQRPVELHGAIGAIDPVANTVVIGDRILALDPDTVIRRGWTPIALTDLVTGEPAVAAAVEIDGKLHARVIQVWPAPKPGDELDVAGPVGDIGTDAVTIGGKRLVVDSATVIRRGDTHIALTDLKLGEPAWAHARVQADGALLAIKIQVRDKHE